MGISVVELYPNTHKVLTLFFSTRKKEKKKKRGGGGGIARITEQESWVSKLRSLTG